MNFIQFGGSEKNRGGRGNKHVQNVFLEVQKVVLSFTVFPLSSVFRGNIPGFRVSDGELLCDYLPPIPIQGTGFHRFVFCLLKQSGELDLNNYVNTKPR